MVANTLRSLPRLTITTAPALFGYQRNLLTISLVGLLTPVLFANSRANSANAFCSCSSVLLTGTGLTFPPPG